MAPDPNLVVVCVDCLRQDFTGGERAVTPVIDELVEEGLGFTEMHATTTTTTPSVAGLFTGSYGERNGVNSLQQCDLQDDVPTMAEALGRAGYETAALVTGPLVPETGLDRGFDHYWYREKEEELVGDWFDVAVERLDGLAEPFFVYLHLWELHKPVEPPPEYDEPRYGDNRYERALSALDPALGALLDEVPEDTVVALHGDHGEAIAFRGSDLRLEVKNLRDRARWERGWDTRALERGLNRLMRRFGPDFPDHFLEEGHGEGIWDFMTNVPLVLHGPGVPSGTVDAQCRQIDVLPTLADLLDIPLEAEPDGESLLPPDEVTDRPAYIRACGTTLRGEANWQRGIRHEGYKYVTYPNRDWSPELYRPAENPSELHLVEDEAVETNLHGLLPEGELLPSEKLEIEDRLADLGYL